MITHNNFPIPPRYLEPEALAKFSQIDQRFRSFGERWQANCGTVLAGPTGSGKSLAAAQALRRLTLERPDLCPWVRWVRADRMSRLLCSRETAAEVDALKSSLILVIDELGYERFPELALEILGERHDRSLVTVVTTGMTPAELQTRYGDATVRRVVEIGQGRVVDAHAKLAGSAGDWGPSGLPRRVLLAQGRCRDKLRDELESARPATPLTPDQSRQLTEALARVGA